MTDWQMMLARGHGAETASVLNGDPPCAVDSSGFLLPHFMGDGVRVGLDELTCGHEHQTYTYTYTDTDTVANR